MYAQMTLQPLNPVRHRGLMIRGAEQLMVWYVLWNLLSSYGFDFSISAARAERCVLARGDGDHEQAASELLLQDADGKRHQHAWRVLCAPSCCGARLPPSGVMSVIWGGVPFV